jgi:ribonuclease P protein component
LKNFGLSSSERIKKAKDFNKIYLDGKVLFSDDKRLKVTYFTITDQENPVVKITAAVSKKSGKAVWRNRIKRLIKESYRLNKYEINEACSKRKISLCLIFTPIGFSGRTNKKIRLAEVLIEVKDLLAKVKASI